MAGSTVGASVVVRCSPQLYNFPQHEQIRDEYRQDYDPARGGYGAIQKRGPPQQPVKRKHEEEEGAVEANAPPAKRQKTGSDVTILVTFF